ncbi:MAG: UTP--glucose-1-phosphate uridylyltransferase GalU [Terriglobia bacterium]
MTIQKAVLPVAGLGTRFLPATKAQPKEMLPIVDKPLVQYGVEEVAASGIPMVIFVTGRGKNSIEDHFDVSFELERMLAGRAKVALLQLVQSISNLVEIIYVRQKNPLGLGHAILMARELVGNEPFAVLLADDIIDAPTPCLKQMMNVFDRYGKSVVALQRVDKQAVSSYGIIKGKPVNDPEWPDGIGGPGGKDRLYLISDMVEKPDPASAPSNLAIIGRYILTPTIFKELSATRRGKGSEIQLTDALRSLLRKEPVYGYLFEGNRYDAGDKLGFLEATVEMALKRPELGQPFRKYLKGLKL